VNDYRTVPRIAALLLVALGLAACGVDGPPEPPDPKSPGPGLSVAITGTAEIGIVSR